MVHEEIHSKVEYIVAHGISATIENKWVVIGSYHFVFEDENCVIPEGMQERFGQIPPASSAFLHNTSTLVISLKSMKNILT